VQPTTELSEHRALIDIDRSSYFPLEQISAAMEQVPTLANIPLDLQIAICIFLHPSDILALRKVCH
jgi:hypothetical protein